MSTTRKPSAEAIAAKGWLPAHRWLLIRRTVQLAILATFLAGPWGGLWIVKGNLSSSLILGTVPLTDPLVLVQSLFAGHALAGTAILGGLLLAGFYGLIGGRTFCAFVCPLNMVT